jgi:hypothetical protein
LPGGKHQQRQAAASWQGGGARPAAPPFQNSSLLAAHTGAATSWRGPQGSFQYEVARPHAPGSPASTATYATLSLNSTPSERIVPASLNSSSSSSSTIRASSSHAGGSESPSQQGGSRGGSSGKKRGTQLPTWLHILKRKRRWGSGSSRALLHLPGITLPSIMYHICSSLISRRKTCSVKQATCQGM